MREFNDQAAREAGAHEDRSGQLFHPSAAPPQYAGALRRDPSPRGRASWPSDSSSRRIAPPGVFRCLHAPRADRLGFSVGVPVVRGDQVRVRLSAGIDGAALTRALTRQRIPEDWTLFLSTGSRPLPSVRAPRSTPERWWRSLASAGALRAGSSSARREGWPGERRVEPLAAVRLGHQPRGIGHRHRCHGDTASVDRARRRPGDGPRGRPPRPLEVAATSTTPFSARDGGWPGSAAAHRRTPSLSSSAKVDELSTSLSPRWGSSGRAWTTSSELEAARMIGGAGRTSGGGRVLGGDLDLPDRRRDAAPHRSSLRVESAACPAASRWAGLRLRAREGWPHGHGDVPPSPSASDTPAGTRSRSHEPVSIADIRLLSSAPRGAGGHGTSASSAGTTVIVGGAGAPWGVLARTPPASRLRARGRKLFQGAVAKHPGRVHRALAAEGERRAMPSACVSCTRSTAP